ncbi:MAG: glycosyltransferase [Cyanobacteria bacterium P01_G01_bin.54]
MTQKFDANIFLEKIRPELLDLAEVNIFIPNHEQLSKTHIPLLKQIDLVWCKTRCADEIFSRLDVRSEFLGFTSSDRSIPSVQPDYRQFFLLAGKSVERRGTSQILAMWQQNPQFPKLTAIAHDFDRSPYRDYNNICVHDQYVDETTLKQLQNQIGIHLCLSESEGFGHFMMEAMSARACVVTTNAPPMNELVRRERGYLVKVTEATTLENYVSQRYHFCPNNLRQTIETLIASPTQVKASSGQQARAYYEKNTELFQARLRQSLANAISSRMGKY